jgi:ubiquinol-cytochrome c reductase cytochrome b subunit
VADVLLLGFIGKSPAQEPYVRIGQFAAAYYFFHFLILVPLIARFETPRPLPNSITESVLHGEAAEAAPIGTAA